MLKADSSQTYERYSCLNHELEFHPGSFITIFMKPTWGGIINAGNEHHSQLRYYRQQGKFPCASSDWMKSVSGLYGVWGFSPSRRKQI